MSCAKILSVVKYVLACSAGILWLTASGFSQSITVSPLSNPPNTTIFVSGSGFSAGADVDIYFDTTDLALAVTDDTGSFSQIALHVPASALPGAHGERQGPLDGGERPDAFPGGHALGAVSQAAQPRRP